MAKLLTVSRKNHRLMETLKLNLPCNLNKYLVSIHDLRRIMKCYLQW